MEQRMGPNARAVITRDDEGQVRSILFRGKPLEGPGVLRCRDSATTTERSEFNRTDQDDEAEGRTTPILTTLGSTPMTQRSKCMRSVTGIRSRSAPAMLDRRTDGDLLLL